MKVFSAVTFVVLVACVRGESAVTDGLSVEDMLDRCMDGRHHKTQPGPEGSLYNQCAPWKDRACCRASTTEQLHQPLWLNFDWHHCGQLSESCERHFKQDLCFYECSPNVGPWLVPVNMQIRNERFAGVPLCATDCNRWWTACKDDMTCSGNWGVSWNWTSGQNTCPQGAECRTFQDYFGTPSNFCRNIWNGSFEVVDDSAPCFTQWFNGTNPNDRVARLRAEEIVSARGGAVTSASAPRLLVVAIFIAMALAMGRDFLN
ncbi:folate receptor gamma-like [Branchiostoma floridae x Branchiostoma japonicum]